MLSEIVCPKCGLPMTTRAGLSPVAARDFEGCIRRCEACGIGASNSRAASVTHICRNPLDNIPPESKTGALAVLRRAHNVRSRATKICRFGFSTSEDAVAWVTFTHLWGANLAAALLRCGAVRDAAQLSTLLLWGVPIEGDGVAEDLARRLSTTCTELGEEPQSFSEPDVIVDAGDAGLIFVEVKHRSGNDRKPADYRGWARYAGVGGIGWDMTAVKRSGHYELARNWVLLHRLAAGRPATLINLGPPRLFRGDHASRLDGFVEAIGANDRFRFLKVTWPELLGDIADAPSWFARYCRERQLSV